MQQRVASGGRQRPGWKEKLKKVVVFVGDESLFLHEPTAQILETLVSHPGQVFSWRQLAVVLGRDVSTDGARKASRGYVTNKISFLRGQLEIYAAGTIESDPLKGHRFIPRSGR